LAPVTLRQWIAETVTLVLFIVMFIIFLKISHIQMVGIFVYIIKTVVKTVFVFLSMVFLTYYRHWCVAVVVKVVAKLPIGVIVQVDACGNGKSTIFEDRKEGKVSLVKLAGEVLLPPNYIIRVDKVLSIILSKPRIV